MFKRREDSRLRPLRSRSAGCVSHRRARARLRWHARRSSPHLDRRKRAWPAPDNCPRRDRQRASAQRVKAANCADVLRPAFSSSRLRICRRGRARGDARALEPYQSVVADRAQCVVDHRGKVRTVPQHKPSVFAIVPVPTKHALQALPMKTKPERPAGNATPREWFEPWLRDRLREAGSAIAFPLLRSQPSRRVRLQARLNVPGRPDAEVDRKGERRAADSICNARAERLEIDDVYPRADVAPRRPAGEGVEVFLAQNRPDNTPDLPRDVPGVHPQKAMRRRTDARQSRRSALLILPT
jgi:hypothetical protein